MDNKIEIYNIETVNNAREGVLNTNKGEFKFAIRGASGGGRWRNPGNLYVIDADEEVPAIFNSKFSGEWARVRFDTRSKIQARRAAEQAVELFLRED